MRTKFKTLSLNRFSVFHRAKRSKIKTEKRFRLLRNFSIISLSGFVLTTAMLSALYRQQAVRDLTLSTEESNIALTQIFSNTLWLEYGPFLSSTQEVSDRTLANSPQIQQLNEAVIAQLEGLSVARIKVYDLQGHTVFSTEAAQIGSDKSTSSGFLAAKSGQVVSQLGHRDTFQALQSTLEDRDFLSSYVPIRTSGLHDERPSENPSEGSGEIVGVFEVYSDVTPLLMRIQSTQRNLSLGSLLVLATLYGILVLFVRRSDQVIDQQYQQVQSSEQRYRQQSDELASALNELQHTQAQMVQNEKMSSLGQMVAGVAHEINNPVSFVHGNLKHIGRYTQDLIELLACYEEHYPNPHEDIQALADDLDVDFIREDVAKTLGSMKIGTERIREIVRSLRNFSRMDEAERKDVDIHDGLESTLMILQHRLKAQGDRPEIKIVRDFAVLPSVECYPGQLNQVFMNIVANSIDALEKINEERPQITLRTTLKEGQVKIAIADNGIGIPANIQAQIFDPFFTTKAVGKGTGMGMAISHQLITEKHQGNIACISNEGIGTEFIITLPIKLAEDKVLIKDTKEKLRALPSLQKIKTSAA